MFVVELPEGFDCDEFEDGDLLFFISDEIFAVEDTIEGFDPDIEEVFDEIAEIEAAITSLLIDLE